jgi:ferrochelatase
MAERVAVLLGGYGEIEEYDEFRDYNERSLRLLVSKSIKFPDSSIPWLARALERRTRREWERANRYHSPHNAIFERQRAGIESALRRRLGDGVSVFTAFNFCDGLLPEQVLPRIRDAGFDRLVVYPMVVLDSVFTSGLLLQQVNEALGSDGRWIKDMRYLSGFVDRQDFHARLAAHIAEEAAPLRERYAPSQIGVMLLLHGCPLESKGHEVGIRESEMLYHAVRARLLPRFPLVHIGWMNHPTPGRWTSPDMARSAANLIELGARAIVYATTGFVTDNHETMLDIGYEQARLAGQVETLRVGSLNDDPAFLDLAAGWIAPHVSELMHGHDCCISHTGRDGCCT